MSSLSLSRYNHDFDSIVVDALMRFQIFVACFVPLFFHVCHLETFSFEFDVVMVVSRVMTSGCFLGRLLRLGVVRLRVVRRFHADCMLIGNGSLRVETVLSNVALSFFFLVRRDRCLLTPFDASSGDSRQ